MFDRRAFNARIAQFIGFSFWSGLGWLCDLASFTVLVKVFEAPAFIANFISSYVGVTFVWFTSLNTVFGRMGASRASLLFVYWGFQLVSILAYSQLLHLVASVLHSADLAVFIWKNAEIAAKIIVTPFNLVTNFLFMKYLTRFMQQAHNPLRN